MNPDSIPSQFVDVDFTTDPNFVEGDLAKNMQAFRPDVFGSFAGYEDAVPTIPEEEWPQLIAKIDAAGGGTERLVTRIFDQGREGSCVANACTQAVQIVYAKQFGKDKVVQLSPISLYKRIGSSPNSGAMVSDGLDELSTRGILPLSNDANKAAFGDAVMPATGFYERYPDKWEDTAKRFAGSEWLVIRSVAGMITALLSGHPVVVGRAGHSICYVRPTYRNNSLSVMYCNSWREDWGFAAGDFKGGFGLDSMSYVRSSASWCFALRSVRVPN